MVHRIDPRDGDTLSSWVVTTWRPKDFSAFGNGGAPDDGRC